MADLWQEKRTRQRQAVEPLAVRMRPRSLDEFAGQRHFLGPGMMLRRMLEADRLTSVIFYGPPGTGKTTLAELIARATQRHFERGNAAAIGVKEVREVLERALRRLEDHGQRTIFFLDEIHRFSRAQQDVLLGDVERGVITLIGATTENPFFAVNAPLVSRSQIFQFESLGQDDIIALLRRATSDPERGYGKLNLHIDDAALQHWARISDGDARRALSALEIAVLSCAKALPQQAARGGDEDGQGDEEADATPASASTDAALGEVAGAIHIDLAVAEQSIQQKAVVYDPTGDGHYDAASAFIKSMRGSDPDAAIYWLAKMLVAGEDPRFIARRIAILASEDVGNADPRAISVAAAAWEITERVGMPECQLTLAQAVIYMACAPKSNAATVAIGKAMGDVRENRTIPVPRHLRDGHYKGAQRLGNAQGYQYAHDRPGAVADQDYLGVEKCYYEPTDRGYEQRIGQYLQWVRQMRQAQAAGAAPAAEAPPGD